jgi:hypothetical protein
MHKEVPMRRFLIMLIGLAMLVAAAVTLWTAHGPQAQQKRTTGGVLYSQAEIAAQTVGAPGGQPQLGTVLDVPSGGGPAVVPMKPELSQSAAASLSTVQPGELSASPSTTAELSPQELSSSVPLTNDIVLNNATQVQVAPLTTGAAPASSDGQGGMTATASGYEQRVVELEWPSEFQVGRAGSVRVTLKALSGGALQPVAEIAGDEVLATPILITDRYDTYNAFVTATISAPDFSVEAVSPVTQPLQRGGEAEWRWTLKTSSAHTAVISLGLAISWEPKPGQSGQPLANIPIWGQTLQVKVGYVLGVISVPQANITGTVLAVLGFVAQIPMADKILEIMWKLLFGGRRRRERRADDRRHRRY